MAADAPVPCITRASAAMVLTVYNKQDFVFHKERLQLPAPSQCQEMIENANTFLCCPETIQVIKG